MSRHLEITLISAEDLRVNRRPIAGRRNTFAVVKTDPFNVRKTKPDECGGSHPTWNDKFEMEMPMNGRVQFVSVEVLYRTGSGSEKQIGLATIPATDFIGGYSPEGHLNFLSYRLRDEYGDKSGIVNVSIRVKPDPRFGPEKTPTTEKKPAANYSVCSSPAAGLWRPATTMTAFSGGRIVTGVPICGKEGTMA
ncbi:PREDICTED: BON1-associated protein 2 isoform X2 [Tarenaya hassleriana]|uniref:BON1-associated protein 2 isoform X2 n=1 Tax=Tarenaya hassleriana TaxID=28532 RepID=UPI00053C2771|nr:PREDICTED: BON1-associated protein 2 isoform X2 [Tarenaya hassleriana]